MCFSVLRSVGHPSDPDSEDRRQKNGGEIEEELMGWLTSGGRVPEMDKRV
jgi:hypothetical protein